MHFAMSINKQPPFPLHAYYNSNPKYGYQHLKLGTISQIPKAPIKIFNNQSMGLF